MTRATKWGIGLGLFVVVLFISAAGIAVYLISNTWRGQRLLAEGYAAVQRGDCETAILKFDQALKLRLPRIPASYAHANRGYCYSYKGPRDESLRDLDEALRLNPKLAWAFEARGLFYENKGDTEKALQDFSRAIELDRNSEKRSIAAGDFLSVSSPRKPSPIA